jgi:anaerobic ribonucleoside-triphosphate reductase activating protein
MSSDILVRIAQVARKVTVLGPGSRYVVWVQGCPFRCSGCVAPENLPFEGGCEMEVGDLARDILSQPMDGVTFSGGEPFAQARALSSLVDQVRNSNNEFSTMSFTGYTFEALARGTPDQRALLERLDLLVDGPYVASLHTDLRWRASRNQRIIALTRRHERLLSELEDRSAGIEIQQGPEGLRWIGVPPNPGFRQQFEQALRERGVDLGVSGGSGE